MMVALATRHERNLPAARAAGLIVGFGGALLVFAPWQERSGLISAGARRMGGIALILTGVALTRMGIRHTWRVNDAFVEATNQLGRGVLPGAVGRAWLADTLERLGYVEWAGLMR